MACAFPRGCPRHPPFRGGAPARCRAHDGEPTAGRDRSGARRPPLPHRRRLHPDAAWRAHRRKRRDHGARRASYRRPRPEDSGRLAGRVRVALLPEFASHWLAPTLPPSASATPTSTSSSSPTSATSTCPAARPSSPCARRVRVRPGCQRRASDAPRPASTRHVRCPAGASCIVAALEVIRRLTFLCYTQPYHALQAAAWFQPVLAAARVVMTTNSTHALLAAALAGVGVAVLPRFVARRHTGAGSRLRRPRGLRLLAGDPSGVPARPAGPRHCRVSQTRGGRRRRLRLAAGARRAKLGRSNGGLLPAGLRVLWQEVAGRSARRSCRVAR